MAVALHALGGPRWREKNNLGRDDELSENLLSGLRPHRLKVVFLTTRQVRVDGHTPGSYPINALRNAAVALVRTSHLFVCDIDFLPSAGLYPTLLGIVLGRTAGGEGREGGALAHAASMSMSDDDRQVMGSPMTAIVVPAFKLKGKCRELSAGSLTGPARSKVQAKCFEHYLPRVPRHMDALRKCMELNWCEQFCPNCHTHGSTDYSAWWSQQPLLRRITCFDSMRYEPYVLVERTERLPRFDEHFFGYGKNKIQWIAHLQHAGYEFHVLRGPFVIHVPHHPSLDKDSWAQSMKETPHETVNWHVRFLLHVRRLYPNYTLPRCQQFYQYL